MKALLGKLKGLFRFNLINKWKSLLFPELSKYESNKYTDLILFKEAISGFGFAIISYTLFYFLVFVIGYGYYSEINTRMQEEFILKGNSYLSYLFNSYPFNIIYVLALLIIFTLFCSSLIYLIFKMIEDTKIKFLTILSINLLMNVWWIFILFFILIINTSYPFDQTTSVMLFGLLISAWILCLGSGIFFSSRVFVKIANKLVNVNIKRTYFAIYLTQILFFYFIYSIIT
jgi:hypothetical protein